MRLECLHFSLTRRTEALAKVDSLDATGASAKVR